MEGKKMNDKNKNKKETPKEYDRWGKIGVKVVSKPNNEPKGKGRK